jgi:hypothetical protein
MTIVSQETTDLHCTWLFVVPGVSRSDSPASARIEDSAPRIQQRPRIGDGTETRGLHVCTIANGGRQRAYWPEANSE